MRFAQSEQVEWKREGTLEMVHDTLVTKPAE